VGDVTIVGRISRTLQIAVIWRDLIAGYFVPAPTLTSTCQSKDSIVVLAADFSTTPTCGLIYTGVVYDEIGV
jgi:hypothetical protein